MNSLMIRKMKKKRSKYKIVEVKFQNKTVYYIKKRFLWFWVTYGTVPEHYCDRDGWYLCEKFGDCFNSFLDADTKLNKLLIYDNKYEYGKKVGIKTIKEL